MTDPTTHKRPAEAPAGEPGRGRIAVGAHPRTDAGNADRLADQQAGRILWVSGHGWLVWDGRRWARDETNEVRRRAIETARSVYVEAAAINAQAGEAGDADAAKDLADRAKKTTAHAVNSESSRAVEAMVKLGAANERLVLKGGALALDADPDALNVANGVLDLRGFDLRPHDPEEHHTKVAAAEFVPGARSAEWDAFVERVIPDPEVRHWVQKGMGSALRGTYSEDLFIPWGAGKNGKSTFLRAIRHALGDYAMEAAPDLLIQGRGKRNAGEMSAVAELRGRRFVTTIETAEGARLDETFVKQLTGEHTMKARFMRQDLFEFENQATVALATNHKPVIHGNDVAIWERLRLIPFDVHIPAEERDAGLGARLESPGSAAAVLLWLVEGLMNFDAEGLGDVPGAVADATATYQEEMDPLSEWLDAEVERDADGAEPLAWVYRAYAAHCHATGTAAMPSAQFNASMESRGFKRPGTARRVHGGKPRKVWEGLRLAKAWQLAWMEENAPLSDEALHEWMAEEETRAADELKREQMRAAAEQADPKGYAA